MPLAAPPAARSRGGWRWRGRGKARVPPDVAQGRRRMKGEVGKAPITPGRASPGIPHQPCMLGNPGHAASPLHAGGLRCAPTGMLPAAWGCAGSTPHIGGDPGAAVAAPQRCPPTVQQCKRGGQDSRQLLPPYCHPGYFGYGTPPSAFAVSPPSPPFCRGQITRRPRCWRRSHGSSRRLPRRPTSACSRHRLGGRSLPGSPHRSPALPISPPALPMAPLALLPGCSTEVERLRRGRARKGPSSIPACMQSAPPQPVGSGQPPNRPRQESPRVQHLLYINKGGL